MATDEAPELNSTGKVFLCETVLDKNFFLKLLSFQFPIQRKNSKRVKLRFYTMLVTPPVLKETFQC